MVLLAKYFRGPSPGVPRLPCAELLDYKEIKEREGARSKALLVWSGPQR